MRRLLPAVLLCHASASFASSDGALGEIMMFQSDQMAHAMMKICAVRDPDNAAATRQAFEHWASTNRAGLEDLIAGRDQLMKAYQARATEPGPKAAMEERLARYTGLQQLLSSANSQALMDAAKMTDARMRESCAMTREYWMKPEPEPQLSGARTRLHRMLSEVEKSR